jgi:hypothetical protein
VVPTGAAAVYTSVCRHRLAEVFVAEKLPHSFKTARLIIEQNFCAQVAKLVRRQCYACALSGISAH